MKNLQDIMRDFVLRVIREQAFYSERARVTAVDVETNTCTVETLTDGSVIFGVAINAYRGAKFGIFPIPKVESVVTVNYYEKNEAYVAKFGELEQLNVLWDEGTTVEANAENIIINAGELGGLVILQNMVDRLNELEALFSKLQSDFNGWTPVASDGGAALKAKLTAGFGIEIIPDSKPEDFENEKIQQ